MYSKRPRVLVWTGITTYPLGPFKFRLPEGGLITLTERKSGTRLSHYVFMHFPDSLVGILVPTVCTKIFKGEKALYDHTFKEHAFSNVNLSKKLHLGFIYSSVI